MQLSITNITRTQHTLLDHGVVIDDGKIRVVVDVSDKQVRLFSHYINDKGNEKLRTEKVMEFDAFLKMLYAMYLQGKTK